MDVAPATAETSGTAAPAAQSAQAVGDRPTEHRDAAAGLTVRIEPTGPGAELGVARLSASGTARRDAQSEPGRPRAHASTVNGDAAVDVLVEAAALALDDTDLHLTVSRV